MGKNKQSNNRRRISTAKLREALVCIADVICAESDKAILSISGHTFAIHLEGATINITINECPGAQEGAEQ